MGQRFRLVGLKDAELLAGVSALVARGNELTAELVAHLAEVEERLLYAELGFPSLHAYCVQELKLSEGAAGRRVIAARVGRRFPEVLERVARGELHLSAVCALAQHLTLENAGELFEACAGQPRRRVDELLAARFPRADVREEVRRLPEVEPLSAVRFAVRFTADAELRDLIERARALARHRLPSGDLAALVKLALSAFVASEEKRRFGAARAKSVQKVAPPGGVEAEVESVAPAGGVKQTRYVSMAVRRAVYARDGGRCSFVASDGRRCGARAWLEFDHVWPWARRGGAGSSNLRLRCGAHNRLHARRCFGARQVVAKVAARRAA
jgi:hypothetical protein